MSRRLSPRLRPVRSETRPTASGPSAPNKRPDVRLIETALARKDGWITFWKTTADARIAVLEKTTAATAAAANTGTDVDVNWTTIATLVASRPTNPTSAAARGERGRASQPTIRLAVFQSPL